MPNPTCPALDVPPSPWIKRFLPLLRPGGKVLDLAAGGGRHTALFRARGCPVLAVDRDVVGLEARFAGDAGVEVRALDLEDGGPWRLGEGFAGIAVTNYLHRPLLGPMIAALAPGGALLYETFMLGNERFGRPSNPDFLLRPGELLEIAMPALTVIAFEQGIADQPRPAAIQRLAAIKAAIGPLPDWITPLRAAS